MFETIVTPTGDSAAPPPPSPDRVRGAPPLPFNFYTTNKPLTHDGVGGYRGDVGDVWESFYEVLGRVWGVAIRVNKTRLFESAMNSQFND